MALFSGERCIVTKVSGTLGAMIKFETQLPAGVEVSRGVVSSAGIPPISLTLYRWRRMSAPVEGGGAELRCPDISMCYLGGVVVLRVEGASRDWQMSRAIRLG